LRSNPLPVLLALLAAGCAAPAAGVKSGAPAVTGTAPAFFRVVGSLNAPPGVDRFTPSQIAVDPRGRILVADAARGAVYVFDRNGIPTGFLADPAPADQVGGAPRFLDVRGIAAGSGLSVFVLDAGTGRISNYDLNGQLRGTVLDLAGSGVETRFGVIRAGGMTLDPTGQAVITDREGDRLVLFDPQWAPSHELGGPGSGGGGFRDPAGLAADARGRLVVADRGNRLVQVLDAFGSPLADYPFEHAPESVAVDRAGNIYVGDAAGFVTVLFARGGRSEWPPDAGRAGPVAVAVTPDGRRLYAARPERGMVDVVELGGGGAPP
jgi:DNA-binding beta-propeller fold protein YncE